MTETDGCVQFNKNSWHYKITHYVFPSLFWGSKVNLCPYMRHVVGAILSVIFVAGWRKLPYRIQDNAWLIQAELIFFSIIIIASFTLDIAEEYATNPIGLTFWEYVGYGFLGGNLVGVIGGLLVVGVISLSDYIKSRPKKKHRTRGLLKTYMSAKHDKICPCVEFVD